MALFPYTNLRAMASLLDIDDYEYLALEGTVMVDAVPIATDIISIGGSDDNIGITNCYFCSINLRVRDSGTYNIQIGVWYLDQNDPTNMVIGATAVTCDFIVWEERVAYERPGKILPLNNKKWFLIIIIG